jgi:hypothetical protein
MRLSLIAAALAIAMAAAAGPASAQVGFGVYVGPGYDYDYGYRTYDYGPRTYGYTAVPAPEPNVVLRTPAPRNGCGEFFYWNGSRCVDARVTPPDIR